MMRHDAEAVDLLQAKHPDAHIWFGKHASFDHFALMLDQPQWTVLEDGGCWTFYEDVGDGVLEGHWFCPNGANIAAIRRMLDHVFKVWSPKAIVGEAPHGHPNERRAAVLGRAVGAIRRGQGFVLTKRRFLEYCRGETQAQE